MENVLEILSLVPEDGDIVQVLTEIPLFTDQDTQDDMEDRVNLLTLHAAKGLEFPVVFITGMEEGIFPSARAVEGESDLSEERRLCYVGMTRAKERLYDERFVIQAALRSSTEEQNIEVHRRDPKEFNRDKRRYSRRRLFC